MRMRPCNCDARKQAGPAQLKLYWSVHGCTIEPGRLWFARKGHSPSPGSTPARSEISWAA